MHRWLWYGVGVRLSLIARKSLGRLPHVTWLDVLRLMPPSIVRERLLPRPLDGLVAIKAKERGQEPCAVLWDTPLGCFWGRANDGHVLFSVTLEQYVYRIYERGPVAIRKGDIVFDAGSHLGTFTRFALGCGARLVVAFEPEPTNAACFRRNLEKDIQEGRVILIEAALWEIPGGLDFVAPSLQWGSGDGHLAMGEEHASLRVSATTIDETVVRLKLGRVDFIKMDIEGAEPYAIRGGGRTLARFGPRMAVCVYHNREDDCVAIPEAVMQANSSYSLIRGQDQFYFYCGSS